MPHVAGKPSRQEAPQAEFDRVLSTGKTGRVRAKKANIELKLESANGVGVRTQTTAIGAMQSGQATHEHSQYL